MFAVSAVLGVGFALLNSMNQLEPVAPLFLVSLLACFVFVVLLSHSIGVFSQEKREETLGLLNLTSMSSIEIVLGKLVFVGRLWLNVCLFMMPTIVHLSDSASTLLTSLLSLVAVGVVMFWIASVGVFYGILGDSTVEAALPTLATVMVVLCGVPVASLMATALPYEVVVIAFSCLVILSPALIYLKRYSKAQPIYAFLIVMCLLSLVVALTSMEVSFIAHPFALVVLLVLKATGETSEALVYFQMSLLFWLLVSATYLWAAAASLRFVGVTSKRFS